MIKIKMENREAQNYYQQKCLNKKLKKYWWIGMVSLLLILVAAVPTIIEKGNDIREYYEVNNEENIITIDYSNGGYSIDGVEFRKISNNTNQNNGLVWFASVVALTLFIAIICSMEKSYREGDKMFYSAMKDNKDE